MGPTTIAAGAWHQGDRDYQEDRFAIAELEVDRQSLLLVVCDGMGGHSHGGEAAQTARDAFVRGMRDDAGAPPVVRLASSLHGANRALADGIRARPEMHGMGCTLAAVLVEAGRAYWISVGDSPVWLVRMRKLERLNEDHSMAGLYRSQVEKGQLSRKEAGTRRDGNLLRSALMGQEIDLIDKSDDGIGLKHGDAIIVASDGVLPLAKADVAAVIHGRDAAQEAQGLVERVIARRRPRQDNVAVVLYLHYQPAGSTPERAPFLSGRRFPSRGTLFAVLSVAMILAALTTLILLAFYPEILLPS